MTSARMTIVLAGLLLQSCVHARAPVSVHQHLRGDRLLVEEDYGEPDHPYGWWSTLLINGFRCALHTIPSTGGNRIACKASQSYDHQYLFRLTGIQAGDDLDTVQPILTNNTYNLRIFNGKNSYAFVNGRRQLNAGIPNTRPALIRVNKLQGVGQINLETEIFRLKTNAGRFCRLDGSGDNSNLRCDLTSSTGVSNVQMPYSSYYGVNLISLATQRTCASIQASPDSGDMMNVQCSGLRLQNSTDDSDSYRDVLGVALKMPGNPQLTSGHAFAFKFYDTTNKSRVFNWVVNEEPPFDVHTEENASRVSEQWLVMNLLSGQPGVIKPNDTITIRSELNGLYCGVRAAPAYQLSCDKLRVSTTDVPYHFKLGMPNA